VAAGALLFAVNLDRNYPIGPGLFDPGCGALAAAIATAGDSHPIGIGKPERPMFRAAIERMGGEPHRTAMVGDSTASDMAGGRAAGMFTIWLNPEHQGEIPEDVDLHVRDLPELHRLWQRSRD
jgi:4-nitrophenyl phosphatase